MGQPQALPRRPDPPSGHSSARAEVSLEVEPQGLALRSLDRHAGNHQGAYACVFEDAPEGFPIGSNVSERVVFNGYFLKFMVYQAADDMRKAPVLVGRIGWEPGESAAAKPAENSTLRWTLIILGVLFFASMIRWIFQLRKFLSPQSRLVSSSAKPVVSDEIDPVGLDAWVRSVGPEEGPHASDHDEGDAR